MGALRINNDFLRLVPEKKGIAEKKRLSSYRFGFNGKEKDDEIYGSTGTSYDYGFRIYNPRIARFLSVDPLTKSYPMLTPYQFASNTPIWAVDLDGLEARIYTDLTFGIPHSFLSVIDDEGIIHVYTYGQYGQKGTPIFGEGALVHLVGEDANNYINHEFDNYTMSVFEISEDKIDEQAIIDFYAGEMKGKKSATTVDGSEHAPTYANNNNGSSAVKYGLYEVLPTSIWTDNCTSMMYEGIRNGGFDINLVPPIPYDANNYFLLLSKIIPDVISNVTSNEQNAANANFNTTNSEKVVNAIPIMLEEIVITADGD